MADSFGLGRAMAMIRDVQFQANVAAIRQSGRGYQAKIGALRRVGTKATSAIDPAISHPQTQGAGAIAAAVDAGLKLITAAVLQLEGLGTGLTTYANTLQRLDRLGVRPSGSRFGPIDDESWFDAAKTALKGAKTGNSSWKAALAAHRRDLENVLENIDRRIGFHTFPDGREVMLVQGKNKVMAIDVDSLPSAHRLQAYPGRIKGLKDAGALPRRLGYGLSAGSAMFTLFTSDSGRQRFGATLDLLSTMQDAKGAMATSAGYVGAARVFGTSAGVLSIGSGLITLTDPAADNPARVGGGLSILQGGAGIHAAFAGGPTPASVATTGAVIGWTTGDMLRRSYEGGRTPTWYTAPVEGPIYGLYRGSEALGKWVYKPDTSVQVTLTAGEKAYLKEKASAMQALMHNLPGATVAAARPGKLEGREDHHGLVIYLPTNR